MQGACGIVLRTIAGLALIFATGCSAWPPGVAVKYQESAQSGTASLPYIEVHVIALTAAEYQQWNSMSVSQYWAANGPSRQRNENRKIITLTRENNAFTLRKDDAIWTKWSDPSRKYLVILADLPEQRTGGADARRTFVPLDRKNWKYPPQMTITVTRAGVSVAPLPEQRGGMFSVNDLGPMQFAASR